MWSLWGVTQLHPTPVAWGLMLQHFYCTINDTECWCIEKLTQSVIQYWNTQNPGLHLTSVRVFMGKRDYRAIPARFTSSYELIPDHKDPLWMFHVVWCSFTVNLVSVSCSFSTTAQDELHCGPHYYTCSEHIWSY